MYFNFVLQLMIVLPLLKITLQLNRMYNGQCYNYMCFTRPPSNKIFHYFWGFCTQWYFATKRDFTIEKQLPCWIMTLLPQWLNNSTLYFFYSARTPIMPILTTLHLTTLNPTTQHPIMLNPTTLNPITLPLLLMLLNLTMIPMLLMERKNKEFFIYWLKVI